MKSSATLVRDPTLNAYVRGVMCRVAGTDCGGLRLYIVEQPDLNIVSLPNGAVIVWTGALLQAESVVREMQSLVAPAIALIRLLSQARLRRNPRDTKSALLGGSGSLRSMTAVISVTRDGGESIRFFEAFLGSSSKL